MREVGTPPVFPGKSAEGIENKVDDFAQRAKERSKSVQVIEKTEAVWCTLSRRVARTRLMMVKHNKV
jgi:hypothetical protein